MADLDATTQGHLAPSVCSSSERHRPGQLSTPLVLKDLNLLERASQRGSWSTPCTCTYILWLGAKHRNSKVCEDYRGPSYWEAAIDGGETQGGPTHY